MATIKYNNIGIKAVAACVPRNISSNNELKELLGEAELEKTINSIGIKEKRFVDQDVCSSDLCFKAAEILLSDLEINPEEIDGVIFVSQTPDYRQPSTAPLLQYKLGLKKDAFAFDINMACSGYVYGLSVAYSFASQVGVDNVLLLVGETMSKTVSKKDKVAFPLFGDAGSATLISKGDFGSSFFSLNSDGSGNDVIKIKYGGYRNKSCEEGLKEKLDDDGNIRTGEQFYMDGMEVFNFGLRVVPKDIKKVIEFAGLIIDNIDLIIYHQANKFMTDFFSKKLKFSTDKTPYCLSNYGNTSSASIPLTIVSELDKDKYKERQKVVCSGFGAGLSWGSVLMNLEKTKVISLIEY